ncbi:hypothetical protein [Luteibacter sp.]|uniref:hypothetical protein n=1 Tax=Luteibacter sp. TaxID=1886636 RepID=UPI003F7E725C
MRTIEVRYLLGETDGAAVLGAEEMTDVESVSIPGSFADRVFVTRCFTGHAVTRWEVLSVVSLLPLPGTPVIVEVRLRAHVPYPPEEYLGAVLAKSQGRPSHYLHRGKLVEVDFGHYASQVTTTKLRGRAGVDPDRLLPGEMHKRRLGVVVSVGKARVQVVPVTSVLPDATDRTAFELSHATLSKLQFYGGNGKRGFVLCGMVETVSVDRILAPETARGRGHAIRNYRAVITRSELRALDVALTHGTGVCDYEAALAAKVAAAARAREIVELNARLVTLQAEAEAARLAGDDWQEAARSLATRCGASADDEVAFHRELRMLDEEGMLAEAVSIEEAGLSRQVDG